MARFGAVLLACAALLVAAHAAQQQAAKQQAPLFSWGSQPYLVGGAGTGGRTHYQVLDEPHAVVSSLLAPFLAPGDAPSSASAPLVAAERPAAAEPSVLLVFVGSQLQSADLRKASQRPALAPLAGLLAGAKSSLSVPYVTRSDASTPVAQAVAALAAGAEGATHLSLGCGGAPAAGAEELRAAVQQHAAAGAGAGRLVLTLCPSIDAAAAGTAAGVAAEVQQLVAAAQALASSGLNHLGVYASEPAAGGVAALPAPRARALLADGGPTGRAAGMFGPYSTCGPLCQTHVRWLEGMLVLGLLVTATTMGMLCLYLLDAPTRFQTPKDAGRSD